MSTAHEIEMAIRSLPPSEREKLVSELPRLLPELDGDAAWERIVRDPAPRAAFTALLNETRAEYRSNPAAFPTMEDSDFDRRA